MRTSLRLLISVSLAGSFGAHAGPSFGPSLLTIGDLPSDLTRAYVASGVQVLGSEVFVSGTETESVLDGRMRMVDDESTVSESLGIGLGTHGGSGAAQSAVGVNRAQAQADGFFAPENEALSVPATWADYGALAGSAWGTPLVPGAGSAVGLMPFSADVHIDARFQMRDGLNPSSFVNGGVALAGLSYTMTLLPGDFDFSGDPDIVRSRLMPQVRTYLAGSLADLFDPDDRGYVEIGPGVFRGVDNDIVVLGPGYVFDTFPELTIEDFLDVDLAFTWEAVDYGKAHFLAGALLVDARSRIDTGGSELQSVFASVDAMHTAEVLRVVVPEGVFLTGENGGALPFAVVNPSPVPVPAALPLLGGALGLLALGARRGLAPPRT